MFEDDEEECEPKFGTECNGWLNLRKPSVCNKCETGEYYEEQDPDGLDFIFKE